MNPFAGLTNEAVFAFLVCSTGSMESIQKARPKNTVQKNVVECLTRMLTSSPWLKPGDSKNHFLGFLLRGDAPRLAFAAPGLIISPQAEAVSPTAKMFLAALISRSWDTPHSGHIQ
jgi:hypothetical protein